MHVAPLHADLLIPDHVAEVGAQIALPGRRRRHGQQSRSPHATSRAFVIAKEENPVFDYRSADGAAELIAQSVGDEFAPGRVFLKLGEGIARLQHVVLTEEESRAVQIVRP